MPHDSIGGETFFTSKDALFDKTRNENEIYQMLDFLIDNINNVV